MKIEPIFSGQIKKYLFENIQSAQKEIIIVNFVFTPSHKKLFWFTNVLKHAAKRGVKIFIILNGVFRFKQSYKDNLYLKEIFHDKSAHVHLTNNKEIEHRKVFLFDRQKIILGSHNLTLRSLYLNRELSIFLDDPDFSSKIFSQLKKEYFFLPDNFS